MLVGLLHTLAYWWALVLGAADVACAESGSTSADGAVVLQVVRNRARQRWRRYDGTLWTALWSPRQHAHACRWPLTPEHLLLGLQFATDRLPTPDWARRALWYCSENDRPGDCARRCAGRCVPIGRVVHTFWGVTDDRSKHR